LKKKIPLHSAVISALTIFSEREKTENKLMAKNKKVIKKNEKPIMKDKELTENDKELMENEELRIKRMKEKKKRDAKFAIGRRNEARRNSSLIKFILTLKFITLYCGQNDENLLPLECTTTTENETEMITMGNCVLHSEMTECYLLLFFLVNRSQGDDRVKLEHDLTNVNMNTMKRLFDKMYAGIDRKTGEGTIGKICFMNKNSDLFIDSHGEFIL
jgi:hypothetical protein